MILGHGAPAGRAPHPLNSLASFIEARRQGADGVECDVRLTGDGHLAVTHDPLLPDRRAVASTPLSDFPSSITDLATVLDVCAGLVVNVEIKSYPEDPAYDDTEPAAAAVVALLAARGWQDNVVISCFGAGALARVRALAPQLVTAMLLFHDGPTEDLIGPIVAAGHPWVHPFNPRVTAEFVSCAVAAGLRVNVWFNDDETPERVRELAGWGVTGFITCDPAMVRAAVGIPAEVSVRPSPADGRPARRWPAGGAG